MDYPCQISPGSPNHEYLYLQIRYEYFMNKKQRKIRKSDLWIILVNSHLGSPNHLLIFGERERGTHRERITKCSGTQYVLNIQRTMLYSCIGYMLYLHVSFPPELYIITLGDDYLVRSHTSSSPSEVHYLPKLQKLRIVWLTVIGRPR